MSTKKMKRIYRALAVLVKYTRFSAAEITRLSLWAKAQGVVKHDRILNSEPVYREQSK